MTSERFAPNLQVYPRFDALARCYRSAWKEALAFARLARHAMAGGAGNLWMFYDFLTGHRKTIGKPKENIGKSRVK